VHKPLQRFYAESELAKRKGAFFGNGAAAGALEILRQKIFRTVDDSQILSATALYARRQQVATSSNSEIQWLNDHAFAAAVGKLLPPVNSDLHAFRKACSTVWMRVGLLCRR
jgi:hypothetical protein